MSCFIPARTSEILSGEDLPAEAFVFAFRGRDMLLAGERLPRLSDFSGPVRGLLTGTLDGIPCLGIRFPETEGERWAVRSIRSVISGLDQDQVCAVCRTKELIFWRDRRKYCGACGTQLSDSDSDLARTCPQCGERYYPQIAPAVITAVLRDGKILLAHNRNFTQGVFSLIAGFVESGETLEQAVSREIMEETSLKVKNVRYYSSQPWPFPNSLMLGFVAEYDSGTAQPDGTELEETGWYPPEALPKLPEPGSIARRIIDDFREGRL